MRSTEARILAKLVTPKTDGRVRVFVEEKIDRVPQPIERIAACLGCRAVWTGRRALPDARDHVAATGHACWSLTGTWEILAPKGLVR